MKSNIYNRLNVLLFILLISTFSWAQDVSLTILHTNDTHSRVEPIALNSSRNPGMGGYLRRVTAIKQIRNEVKNLLAFDCGDFSQGSPYYNLFKGEVEIKMMNEAGYDAATIGNHEFDFGLENMKRLFEMANFPIVCSNYEVSKTVLKDIVRPYHIFNKDGIKIGVFGLSPKMKGLVQANKCKGIIYRDPFTVAQEMADFLKINKECDVVICLSHLGFNFRNDKVPSDVAVAKRTNHIDLILGGHSHTFLREPFVCKNIDGKEVPIFQMGKNGAYVGRIDLKLAPSAK